MAELQFLHAIMHVHSCKGMDLHAKAGPNRFMIASCGEDASWDVTEMHDKQGSRMHNKQGSVHDSSACCAKMHEKQGSAQDSSACCAEMHDKQGSVHDSSSCCHTMRAPLFPQPKRWPVNVVACPTCFCRPLSAGAAKSRLYGFLAHTPHTVS